MIKGKIKKIVSFAVLGAMLVANSGVAVTAAPNTSSTAVESSKEDLNRKIVGYFPEWAYKDVNHNYFDVADLQWESLTHIQYSFASVNPSTNKIDFGDKFAAIEEDFKGMELSHNGKPVQLDPTLPYKGHFNVLQVMKKQFPDVKLLISVGGWAGSRGFYTMLDTDAGIDTFVQSAVDFIRTYGFDGVDIDFEYPSATSQSGNPDDFDLSEPRRKTINERYNVFIKKLRAGIDKAAAEDNKDYLVTAAVTASSWVLGGVSNNEYAKELDFLSIMSYDFHGGWNEFVENQANIYSDPADKETEKMLMPVLSMDWAYKYYRGVLPPEKILMGIPYYTRGWENVNGGDGTGLHGTSKQPATGKYNLWGDFDKTNQQIPAGANPLWHVLNLMDQDKNLTEHWDNVGKVPHVWQNDEKVFLTFENENSMAERLKYIEEKNLGGALIWVMDGDYSLNPNYVQGSTNVNEGKYTFGNTLTTQLRKGLDTMGPAKKTIEGNDNLEKINVGVKVGGIYDHPNYTYAIDVTNHSSETIAGGWEINFDLPKSCKFTSSWGGTVTTKDNGDFTNVTITSAAWQNLEPGKTLTLQGMIGLCFSGIKNVTFNGKLPVGNDSIGDGGNNGGGTTPEGNEKPVISGATNTTISVNDKFDPMAGVTASDKEDGDLTSKIVVSGTVDTTKAGTYNLTYTVKDSKNAETVAKRVITVLDKSQDTYDKLAVYLAGDKVIYEGVEYTAKWWTQGEIPGVAASWEKTK